MIGKRRQHTTVHVEEIYDPEIGEARGVIRRTWPAGKVRHSRRLPSHKVAAWIAHYWFVEWDLRRCKPQLIETVPHPNVHLVFENGTAEVGGVHSSRFSRILRGYGRVFGVKFQPGGFHPFLGRPVATLANRVVPASRIFGESLRTIEQMVFSESDEDDVVAAANDFFTARMPKPNRMVALAGQLVKKILSTPDLKKVEDLVIWSGLNKRRLKRLFREYVGASPKWVIQRYRLHELLEQINSGRRVNWSQLALELGYFDQAHLINHFKSIIGCSPAQHKKRVRTS